jgi:hypothetical protein
VEPDQNPHHTPEYLAVDRFLKMLMDFPAGTPEDVLRTTMLGFLGTTALSGRPCQRVSREDGWAELLVGADGDNVATVRRDSAGVQLEFKVDLVEARAYLLAANATQTALRFVEETFTEVLTELRYQVECFRSGREPLTPVAREEQRGTPERQTPQDPDHCLHPLPSARSMPPYTMRPCPACGTRFRSYPAGTVDGDRERTAAEWQEVPV